MRNQNLSIPLIYQSNGVPEEVGNRALWLFLLYVFFDGPVAKISNSMKTSIYPDAPCMEYLPTCALKITQM